MTTQITNDGLKYKVVLSGRIDASTAEEFQNALAPLMQVSGAEIDVDCAELAYTSSQGLRTFLSLQKSVSANGGTLVLHKMNPQVKEVFDITGFSSIIKIL